MRLHDLRHQAATGTAQRGVLLDTGQIVQNQITGRRRMIGAVYDQHDYALEERRALELWERRLMAIVSGQQISSEGYHKREMQLDGIAFDPQAADALIAQNSLASTQNWSIIRFGHSYRH